MTGAGNNTYLLPRPAGCRSARAHRRRRRRAASTWPTSTAALDGRHAARRACSSRTATPIMPPARRRSRPRTRRARSPNTRGRTRTRGTRVAWQPLARRRRRSPAGDEPLTALHTPGHSPDHLAFWHEPSAHDLHRRSRRARQQRDDPLEPRRRSRAVPASLERLLALEPRRLLPAHGPAIDDPQRVLTGYLEHRRHARAAGHRRACAPATPTVQAIAESIYDGLAPALMPAAQRKRARAPREARRPRASRRRRRSMDDSGTSGEHLTWTTSSTSSTSTAIATSTS